MLLALKPVQAQTGFDLDIKKPEPYDNRVLRAEKTGTKKFTVPRRFFQNTYTHYNYFFNANNKLNDVIDRVKAEHIDNYEDLLSFYNYSLEGTAEQKSELDSVIYKSRTAIVMHDLRSDWADNMYILWGEAFYFQKQFDSARQMFQFINYAFADKDGDGSYKYIGSNLGGGNAQNVVTKEQNTTIKRLTSRPPSRNMAFIWQVRTLIELDAMTEASSLIATLKNDTDFPERLNPSLNEVQAYWFYNQEKWDSAAFYLTGALDNAKNKQERARWQYLIGQLFAKAGNDSLSKVWFNKSIDNTIDPVLDIYARLNLIRLNKEGGDNYIDQNIAELAKMARREKYLDYRDVIYNMMAQMELERGNHEAAEAYLKKGVKYQNNNSRLHTNSYLTLADLAYKHKKYTDAASYYDSVKVNDDMAATEKERISNRLEFLTRLTKNLNTIKRQDSLQRIAGLPEDERTDFLKKLARQLRRQQGLKEETVSSAMAASITKQSDPFNSSSKGEWYFYNKTSRERGATTFKQIWGNRTNSDNWRRGSSMAAELRASLPLNTQGAPTSAAELNPNDISYITLLGTLPITPLQIKISNDSIKNALLGAGSIYFNKIEDYEAAIQTYEELRKRFSDLEMSEVLFNLYYAYKKSGNMAKANEIKNLLLQNYSGSRYASILKSGVDPLSTYPTQEVTKTYEGIYDMFIEGRFDEAKAAKQEADSTYKTNYWSPQLLYIESVYYIKQNQDSTAKTILNQLINQNAKSAMAEKARTMLDVLSRRKEIEEELNKLQIERPKEEVVSIPETKVPEPVIVEPEMAAIKRDTSSFAKKEIAKNNPKLIQKAPEAKKDVVVARDVRFPVDSSTIKKEEPKDSVIDKILEQPKEIIKKEEPVITEVKPQKPADAGVPAAKPQAKDSVVAVKPSNTKPTAYGFIYDTEAPHYAVVILNKVDNIFGNEARNAFNRFSKENYINQVPNAQLLPIDAENKLLLIGTFSNFALAADYVQKAKPVANTQIVPWLKAEKYTFTIISVNNLEALRANPNLADYKKFLEQFAKPNF